MEHNGKIIGNAEELQYILPGRDFHSTWASPEALARYIQSHSSSDCWQPDNAYKSTDESFTGTETMDEAIGLAQNGWMEGAEKIEKLRSYIQNLYPMSPRNIRYGVAGAPPNVPRAIAGAVLNMRLPDPDRSRKRPVLTLVCNMCANWSISKDVLSNRAAAVAALIDKIESDGFACEVISTALTNGGYYGKRGYKAATSVVVKQSHNAVDLPRLAFGLGHASMFRRLIFADWQLEPSCEDGLGSGLGSTRGNYSDEDLEKMHEKDIYFVPSAEDSRKFFADDESTALKGLLYLINALRKQGCPAFAKMSQEDKDKIKLTVADPEYDDDDDYDYDEDDDD